MEKLFLEDCLAKGMSLDSIGDLAGRHPSTVGYWLKKHGLRAGGAGLHAAKGPLDKAQLEVLVEEGLTLREIAHRVNRSLATVRYWLRRHDLSTCRRRRERPSGGPKRARMECRRHGMTEFVLEGRGCYRCVSCRAEAVTRRRRAVKRTLVEEAGGECRLCGYSRCDRALQFHHLDPEAKEFHLGHGGAARSLDRSRVEARKCVLLCANCHAEVEAGLVEMPLNCSVDANPM